MATHGSAIAHETPHTTETTTTISDALRRRAQAVINDRSIDPQWRAIIRYGLETDDPWLADLVRRADAGETIIDTLDFSLAPESDEDDFNEERIHTLAERTCKLLIELARVMLATRRCFAQKPRRRRSQIAAQGLYPGGNIVLSTTQLRRSWRTFTEFCGRGEVRFPQGKNPGLQFANSFGVQVAAIYGFFVHRHSPGNACHSVCNAC